MQRESVPGPLVQVAALCQFLGPETIHPVKWPLPGAQGSEGTVYHPGDPSRNTGL